MLDRGCAPDAARAGTAAGGGRRARAIFGAAVACDYETLEQIALEKGEGFTFSYGAATTPRSTGACSRRPAAEPSRCSPRDDPDDALHAQRVRLLRLADRLQESPTDDDWQALVDAGLYTQEQIDAMKAGGSYLGYRTAITADGDWQFFVAGD